MLVPVSNQGRLAVLCFQQIFQCVQLVRMYPHHAAAIGINCTAGKLRQLSAQDTCICRRYGIATKIQTHILLHVFVDCRCRFIKLYSISSHHQLRHLQMVSGFHGNANVSNLCIDFLFRTLAGRIGKAVPVRGEIRIAVLPDSLAQPDTFVQQAELCPQIHETVAAGRTGQPNDAFYERADIPQCTEAF